MIVIRNNTLKLKFFRIVFAGFLLASDQKSEARLKAILGNIAFHDGKFLKIYILNEDYLYLLYY